MAKIGDIGTLKELGVMPGDVVINVDENSGYQGFTFNMHANQSAVMVGRGGYVDMNCNWKFRLISRASATPALWRDMTPEQRAAVPQSVFDDPTNPLQIPWGEWSRAAKGAVLLARHEGKVIEWTGRDGGKFVMDTERNGIPIWSDYHAYRVRPEPPRVDLMADGVKVGTVAMRDGKVEPDSVEWVE